MTDYCDTRVFIDGRWEKGDAGATTPITSSFAGLITSTSSPQSYNVVAPGKGPFDDIIPGFLFA
jgi:hypothetical protein